MTLLQQQNAGPPKTRGSSESITRRNQGDHVTWEDIRMRVVSNGY